MLGLGWTEMMVIGVVALIVIGPKDLPMIMQKAGKFMGQIRRMGSEFQREINKSTGLDEVRNLRKSITEPLRKSSDEIRREFNAMTPKGPQPSGLIKPADPAKESVVDELRAAAGMETLDAPAQSEPANGPVKAPVKAARIGKPAKVAAVPDGAVERVDLVSLDVGPAETVTAPKAAAKPRKPASATKTKPEAAGAPEASQPAVKAKPVAKAATNGSVMAAPAKKPVAKKAEAKTPNVAPVDPAPAHGGEA